MRPPLTEGSSLADALRGHLDPQQPALDRAVPDLVRAVRAQAELHAELGCAGEHRGVPALETLAQHLAQLAVQRASALVIGEAHAVGRIGAEKSGPIGVARRERRGLRQEPPRALRIALASRSVPRRLAAVAAPAAARASASARSRSHNGASWPRQP